MTEDHGRCPHCNADLNGGSIWETGYQRALEGKHYEQHGQPCSPEEAEQRADIYAEAYGATRTEGRWGRAIGWEYDKDRIEEWECPDCHRRWPRCWTCPPEIWAKTTEDR